MKWATRKSCTGGIHEFRAAAYMKDLVAGKLDARAKKGHFVGYDSESKGYQIHWPEKCLIMVKRNVVFNQDDTNTLEDTAIIYDEVMSEGEKEKIIQNLQNNVKDVKKSVNEESEDQETSINRSEPHQRPKSPLTSHYHNPMMKPSLTLNPR